MRTMRFFFDLFSGYTWGKKFGTLDEKKWLTRIIFLETVAGVPGESDPPLPARTYAHTHTCI